MKKKVDYDKLMEQYKLEYIDRILEYRKYFFISSKTFDKNATSEEIQQADEITENDLKKIPIRQLLKLLKFLHVKHSKKIGFNDIYKYYEK